ncbi:MAG: PD40 domain-containing protein [Alphaproteobacteria bacterium]|nr:PD40 domain-containing protein [Alphaproteobacteria bacterium]
MQFGGVALGALMTAMLSVSAVADGKEKWDVSNPPVSGAVKDVKIDTREGTWMSLDVSPDGKSIAFDLLGDIYVMPISGGKATPIASGVAWEMQPRFSPDGSEIAFTSDREGGDNIWVMKADGSDMRQITKESFRLLNNPTWSPDGTYIAARKHFTTYRSLGTGEIWMYHASGRASGGVQVVKRPNDAFQKELGEPMFTADGSGIYYTMNVTPGNTFLYAQDSNTEVFQIKKVSLADGEVETVAGGPGGAVRPTPSPDGSKLAFVKRVRAKSRLFVKDLASGELTMLDDNLDYDMQEGWAVHGLYPNMDWTPDGREIVYWSRGKLWRIDAANGRKAEIPFHVEDTRTVYAPPRFKVDVAPDTFRTKMVRFAAPSPDGKSVVFESLGALYVKHGDGEAKKLTRGGDYGFELSPKWSADGKTIYFLTWDDQKLGSIRKVSAKGGKAKAVLSEPGHYADLAVDGEGNRLLYRKREGGYLLDDTHGENPGVYMLDTASGKSHLVTKSGSDPQFAAHGRVLVKRGGNLVSVTADGFDARTLATTKFGTDFALSPSGSHILWRENYHVYMAPLPKSGQAVSLAPSSSAVPVAKLSRDGGTYIGWADDSTAYWTIGPVLKKVTVAEAYATDFKAPESGLDMSMAVNAAKPEGVTAITGARIVTMDEAGVIEGGTILIEGNRITAVGKDVAVPKGARVVDATGKTIIPGFVDIHAHGPYGSGDVVPEQNWNAMGHLAFGVTTIHNPSSTATLVFAASEYQQAGKILSPRTFSTAEIVYGAKASYWAPVDAINDALAHARRLKAQGAISIKNYNQPRRDQRQQVVEAGRQLGLNVVAEGGSLFHQDMNLIVDGNTGVEHTLPNQHIYGDVLQFWPQTDVGFTPTLNVAFGGIGGENYWYKHLDVWKHPRLSHFVPPAVLQPRSVRREMAPEEDYGDALNAAFAKDLMDRGVSVHTGAHGQREGFGTHWEMWSFVRGGMSPLQAIEAATIAPARYMGMDDDIGSLKAGKLADLVIVDGDPLSNIRDTDKLTHVMLNGRLYRSDTLAEEVTGDYKPAPFYWADRPESAIR